MQHWKVPRWATWLCPLIPSLGPFQLSHRYLTCRYHRWWYGGGGTSSSPAESNSVARKLQSRSSRSIWASFISEVRLNAHVDAEGAAGGWGVGGCVQVKRHDVMRLTVSGLGGRPRLRVAGSAHGLSMNPGLDQLKCLWWILWGQTNKKKYRPHFIWIFAGCKLTECFYQSGPQHLCSRHYKQTSLDWNSHKLICPHAVPLVQFFHLLIFLFRKKFYFFPFGQFMIRSNP